MWVAAGLAGLAGDSPLHEVPDEIEGMGGLGGGQRVGDDRVAVLWCSQRFDPRENIRRRTRCAGSLAGRGDAPSK